MGKIGVYGGSFNPIHLGHIRAAESAAEALDLDQILLIPASTPPHKILPDFSPTGAQRLELICRSVVEYPRLQASDIELLREGPSYTVDTLTQLKALHPGDGLYLLIGTDMFLSLHRWYRPDEICRLANIVCFSRADADDPETLRSQARNLEENLHARVSVLPNEPLEMSSTTVRRMLFFDCAEDYLAPAALQYIRENRLYGVNRDWTHLTYDRLKVRSLSLHKPQRIAHAIGVSETAVRLAERYGARVDYAMRAGILHDMTKALDGPEQLRLCRRYGIELTPFEETHPKLLHSKTGAAAAVHIFGEREETALAINWHTTGHADMTLLEKILYIADYAEPNRCFDGVEKIREVLYRDLDLALYRGFCMSLEELEREGKPLDRHSIEACDFLKRKKGFA